MSDLKYLPLSGYTVSDITVIGDADKHRMTVNIEVSRPVNRFKLTLRVVDKDASKGKQHE